MFRFLGGSNTPILTVSKIYHFCLKISYVVLLLFLYDICTSFTFVLHFLRACEKYRKNRFYIIFTVLTYMIICLSIMLLVSP